MTTFAKSSEGQFYFHLFSHLGITPQDWRELDPRDAAFLANAFVQMNENKARQQRRSR